MGHVTQNQTLIEFQLDFLSAYIYIYIYIYRFWIIMLLHTFGETIPLAFYFVFNLIVYIIYNIPLSVFLRPSPLSPVCVCENIQYSQKKKLWIYLILENEFELKRFKVYTVYPRVRPFWIYTTVSLYNTYSLLPTCVLKYLVFSKIN